MNITLTELRYIIAVAQEKHFGRASLKCFVSQPTLSIAIKKLEDNLGITIFERDKNRVILTELGKEIIAQAQQVLELVNKIKDFAKYNKDPFTKPLKIGAIHTVGPYLFPQLIKTIEQNKQSLHLLIEEGFTSTLYDKLIDGELDAIIVAKPFSKPNITTIELYTEPLDMIIPYLHHWKTKKTINPKELAKETLLLLGSGHCFRDQVLQICPECILHNNVMDKSNMIITSSLETIKYMVAGGTGVSIMPRSAIKDISKLIKSIPFIKPYPKRSIILAFRNSFTNKIVIEALVKTIQTLKLT